MTEKRFYTDGQYVMQGGEVYVACDGEHNADVVATTLNELVEERNKLQFDYNMEVLTRQSIEKENEQLKKERLTWLKSQEELECLSEENKKLKRYNKGQELEIVRLHGLADAMSSVLRELGIYDVYNEEQINSVKERLR